MPDLPPITFVATTWLPEGDAGLTRMATEQKAIFSWQHYAHYAGLLRLHVADDGSIGQQPWRASWAVSYSRQHRRGVGASLNAAFRHTFEDDGLALYAVGDWALSNALDLTPWARLLIENESIGAVRLGPPHPDLTGRVMHLGDLGWALALDRHHYAFSFRPTLFHKRMYDWLGGFEEGVSSLECERLANERWCRDPSAPGIVLALPSPFTHLYSVELSAIQPEGAKA